MKAGWGWAPAACDMRARKAGSRPATPAISRSIPSRSARERTVFRLPGTDPSTHIRNFLDCVKSRTPANANADVAARSHVACHAAYIAWQLGRTLKFDPVKEEFIGDETANRMRSLRDARTVADLSCVRPVSSNIFSKEICSCTHDILTLVRLLIIGILLVPAVSTFAQQDPPATGDEAALLSVLAVHAPIFDKAKACQQLAMIGTKDAVPVLAKLLADEQLVALRRALPWNRSPIRPSTKHCAPAWASSRWLAGGRGQQRSACGAMGKLSIRSRRCCRATRSGGRRRGGLCVGTHCFTRRDRHLEGVARRCRTSAIVRRRRLFDGGRHDGEGRQDGTGRYRSTTRCAGRSCRSICRLPPWPARFAARGEQGVDLLVEQLKSADDDFFEVGLSMAHLIPGDAHHGNTGRRNLEADARPREQCAGTDHHQGRIRRQGHIGPTLRRPWSMPCRGAACRSRPATICWVGDPVPNVVKSLRVSYTLGGEAEESRDSRKTACSRLRARRCRAIRARRAWWPSSGKRGDRAALPVILKLAQDGPWDVRLAALLALAKLGDASAVPCCSRQPRPDRRAGLGSARQPGGLARQGS